MQHAVVVIDQDRLIAAKLAGSTDSNLMPLGLERVDGLLGQAGFQNHFASIGHSASGGGGRSVVSASNRFTGELHVHLMIDDVDENLHLALRLHVTPHHPETQPRLAIFGHHGRDDGVKGTLVGLQNVGVPLFKREETATVLQRKTQVARHMARAPRGKVAFDERDDIAVLIDHRQVDGIASLEFGVAGLILEGGLRRLISFRRSAAYSLLIIRSMETSFAKAGSAYQRARSS